MPVPLIVGRALAGASGLGLKAAPYVAAAMVGAGLMAAWERQAPFGWGLADKLAASQSALAASREATRSCKDTLKATVDLTWKWKGQYDVLAELRRGERDKAAAALGDAQAFYRKQCSQAFDEGVKAGRIMGDANGQPRTGRDQPPGVALGNRAVDSPVAADRARGPDADGVRDDFAESWTRGREPALDR